MMRNILFISAAIAAIGFTSCDKVDNPFPEQEDQGSYELYPLGDSAHYADNAWPTFSPNTNTQRNLVIEDFTGHKCIFCPPAADTAHALYTENPGRVFVATIHSGPTGIGSFQSTDASFTVDWTNPDGLAIGQHFGSIPGTVFVSNPKGNVSRILNSGQHFSSPSDWRGYVQTNLPTALRVNIQSAVNYYPSTRGVFLHTEIEKIDAGLTNNLYAVVYLIEDSIIGKQKMPNNTTNDTYLHEDVMRDCVSSNWEGKELTVDLMENGKYYLNYIYKLPEQYDADNVHFLIYVRDEVTEEIYHVIEQDLP